MRSNLRTSSILIALSTAVLGLACGADPSGSSDDLPATSTDSTEAPRTPSLAEAPLPGGDADPAQATGAAPGTDGSGATPSGEAPPDAPPPDGTTPPAPPPVADPPADDPGPKPTAACSITKDASGFFTRSSALGSYVGYVPASYDGSKPVRLVVGLHGCGDDAKNFATWGPNPYDGRATQEHIGIAVDGATGGNSCWNKGVDDAKVLAAIDDVMSCFWIHQKKVTLAGFSSGGELAYRVGLMHADRFAGILIESSGLYAASNDEDALVAGAAWKLPIAHVQHSGDTVFDMAKVEEGWAKLKAAGFPVETSITGGGHDGTSVDWNGWLLPRSAVWARP
jgi:predicted esterase